MGKLEQAALRYVGLGWPVVPLKERSKEPAIKDWPNKAFSTPQEVKEYWSKHPDAGVGILTGPNSGLLVIDIDPRNGGEDTWDAMRESFDWVDTAVVQTGGGGRHIYYRWPEDLDGARLPKSLGPGVDIQGEGRFVVAPPSVHPDGGEYVWEGFELPTRDSISDPPQALVAAIRSEARARACAGASYGTTTKIPVGQRNTRLTSYAGRLRAKGLELEEIETLVLEKNRKACEEPLPDDEARKIVRSIGRYPPGAGGFPVLGEDALYGLAGEFVRGVSPHTEAHPAALLALFLCQAGCVIGRGAWVRVEDTEHHPRLFLLLVGDTAKSRKGTAQDRVDRLFLEAFRDWDDHCAQGLSSGEGLIHAVRDQRWAKDKEGNEILLDEGVADKRLLVREPEFASVLAQTRRDGNTLSAVLRNAWDGKTLLGNSVAGRCICPTFTTPSIAHFVRSTRRRSISCNTQPRSKSFR
jgi:hypothetical protein